jgi:DNA-binding NtrC family response regulator
MLPSVLIIDDEPKLREILVQAVGSWGFETAGARSAEEALRRMETDPADISILDLNLPSMAGMELFEKLRSRWPNHQVIVLTGFGDLASARSAIQLDVVDFLTKPCRLGELERALDRARRRLVVEPREVVEETPAEEPTTLEAVERQHILTTLRRQNGNRTATAAELGISRRTLQYKLVDYARQGFDIDE